MGRSVTWPDLATAALGAVLGYVARLSLESWKSKVTTSERLQDLRRVECVRMLTSSERVVQFELPPGVEEKAKADLADADSTLQLLGPSPLTVAASALAVSARAAYGIASPPGS